MQSSLYKFLFTLFLNVLNLFSPMIYGVSVGILLCNWKLGSRIYFFYQISFDLVLMRKRMIIISSSHKTCYSVHRWAEGDDLLFRCHFYAGCGNRLGTTKWGFYQGGVRWGWSKVACKQRKCLLEYNGLCVLNNFTWMTERPSVNCTWSVRQIKNTHELSANRSRGH